MRNSLTCTILFGAVLAAAPVLAGNPGDIDAFVTPYYNSSGPAIRIGKYSAGLASKSPGEFVSTIVRMKRQWEHLNFVELYVGAIRLYDSGYRDEATYWFYTAQYRGRQFGMLLDKSKMGGLGNPGFELYHAQEAFFQLTGPDINGYAFGNVDRLVAIVQRVRLENRTVQNMQTTYPGVSFVHRSQWQQQNAALESGLGSLATSLAAQKTSIAQQRAQNGTAARFAQLTSKRFPGSY